MSIQVSIEDLEVGYSSKNRLIKIDELILNGAHVNFLIGPNGIGKSTLFKTLAGITKAIHGGYSLSFTEGDRRIRLSPREVAYMHRADISSNIKLSDFLSISLRALGDSHNLARAYALCEELLISDLLSRSILQLSDGELQKAHIALAASRSSRLLLLDEPYVYLDPLAQSLCDTLFKELASDKCIWICSHRVDRMIEHKGQIFVIRTEGDIQVVDKQVLASPVSLKDIFNKRSEKNSATGSDT